MFWPLEGLTSWLAHLAVAGLGLSLLLVLCALLVVSRLRQRRLPKRIESILAIASFLGLAAPPISIWVSTFIAANAEEIASDKDYCIQVADRGGDYRPVTTLTDLSPLTLDATNTDGVTLQYRALLIVGSGPELRVYNWSYRSFAFDDGAGLWSGAPIGGPVIRCLPKKGFADALPVVGPGEDPTEYIRLNNFAFRIPSEYRPAPTSGHHPTIIVSAVAPEFIPPQRSDDRPDIRAMVEVQLIPRMPLEKYARMENKEILERAEEFGLQRIGYGSAGSVTSIVYAFDVNGMKQTLIVCGVPKTEPVLCQQYFVHDGIQYTFFHASNVVRDWREMQSRLIALVQNWRAST